MTNLIFVVPHPDDESLYCGGLIAKANRLGYKIHCIYLTSGQHGRTLGLVKRQKLAEKRKEEAINAALVLGINKTTFLAYDDYDPKKEKLSTWVSIREKVNSCIEISLKETIIISFPPNGINGHPDHIQASKIAYLLSEEKKLSLLYITSQDVIAYPDKKNFMLLSKRKQLHLKPNYMLKLTPKEIQKKLLALSSYRTQALSILSFIKRSNDSLVHEHYFTNKELSITCKNLFAK